MLSRSKLLFAALAAAATMLALVANAASARNLSTDEQEFTLTFIRGIGFEAAGTAIVCTLTVTGDFLERTFPKTRTQIGVVRHVSPSTAGSPTCIGGTITVLAETLPWRLAYSSFTGTLPAITDVRTDLVGVAFRVSNGSVGCLAGTTSLKPAFAEFIIGSRGRVEGFRFDETVKIPLGGSFICEIAGESTISGTGEVRNLPASAALTMNLI